MKEIYKKPEADVICFAPATPIAQVTDPTFDFEEGVFSPAEAKTYWNGELQNSN